MEEEDGYTIIIDACLFSNKRERKGVDLGGWGRI